MEDVFELFSVQAAEKSIQFSYEIMDKTPTILYSDEKRIKQIILNVITNAFKFTFSGQVKVTIRSVYEEFEELNQIKKNIDLQVINSGKEKIRIDIEDSGIGIKKEDRQKLFKLFGKLDNACNINMNGVGLGLTICRKLCEQLGGIISFNSKFGVGSTFWFTIPYENEFPMNEQSLSNASEECKIKDYKRYATDTPKISSGYLLDTLNIQIRSASTGATKLNSSTMSFLQEYYEKNLKIFNENKILSPQMLSQVQYTGLNPPSLEFLDNKDYHAKREHGRFVSIFKIISSLGDIKDEESPLIEPNVVEYPERKEERRADILIVDDSVFNLITLHTLIDKTYGLKCQEASNGEIAIDMIARAELERRQYKLVFMDCNMPVIDGFEATKMLRRMMAMREISSFPIIALTALTSNSDKKKCIEAGMDQHLSKPVLIKEVTKVLKDYYVIS